MYPAGTQRCINIEMWLNIGHDVVQPYFNADWNKVVVSMLKCGWNKVVVIGISRLSAEIGEQHIKRNTQFDS